MRITTTGKLVGVFWVAALASTPAAEPFLRGDVDGDGSLRLADAVRALRAVAERVPPPCADAADFTDNGLFDLGDPALLMEYLLKGAPDPRPPFPDLGLDPTPDDLGCGRNGEPAPAVEGSAAYSLSVLPPLGGNPGFRLRVHVEATEPLLGGRIVLGLPNAWAADGIVLDVRPSLAMAGAQRSDGFAAARIGTDRRLTCLWILSRSDFSAALPPGPRTELFDISLCGGSTPAGGYDLLAEAAEAVTADGLEVPASSEGASFEQAVPAACPEPVESAGALRPYLWLSDARAEPGETFRVSLRSATSFDSRTVKFRLDWDPEAVRGVWAEWIRTGEFVGGHISNLEDVEPGTQPYDNRIFTGPGLSFMSVCHPCTDQNAPWAAIDFWSYHPGEREHRPRFPADTELHHMDLIFQVLPGAPPGETWIELYDDPTTPFADNFANVFREVPLVDEIKYPAAPLLPARVQILPPTGIRLFQRADANGDGSVEISDPILTLAWLFQGSPDAPACMDAADSNDDGIVDISDPVHTLGYLFLGGPLVPPPFWFPGTDYTEDSLGCGR